MTIGQSAVYELVSCATGRSDTLSIIVIHVPCELKSDDRQSSS